MSLRDHFSWLYEGRRKRDRFECDMDEELRFHIESQVEDRIKSGMSPEEARRTVLLVFGGTDKTKEECRDTSKVRWLDECRQDLRYAFRILAKSPGFTALAVLMLALGIGANTAIVSAIDGLIFRPMPFEDIARLVTIDPGSSFPNYLDIRADSSVYSGVAAYMGLRLEAHGANGDMRIGRAVSANYFQVLGLRMAVGRGFLPERHSEANSAGRGTRIDSSLQGNVRRAIDIHEGGKVDEVALRDLILAEVVLNLEGKLEPKARRASRKRAD